MGWVADKIAENTVITKKIEGLWNSLRDSVGEAMAEFQIAVAGSDVHGKDCKARGRFCIRIEKQDSFLEVFLDQSHRLVKSANLDSERTICGYRLDASRQGLEFFASDPVAVLSADEFLFMPFPERLMTKTP